MPRKSRGDRRNAGRSTTGEAAVPYYVESPRREAAKHLRLMMTRFLAERAAPGEVDEAIRVWRDAAKTSAPTPGSPVACDPDRALAAAEVLAAVWLRAEKFELEHRVDDPPVAEVDDEGHTWVTVRIHVPALDVDLWLDGTHCDHPGNQDDDDEDDDDEDRGA